MGNVPGSAVEAHGDAMTRDAAYAPATIKP